MCQYIFGIESDRSFLLLDKMGWQKDISDAEKQIAISGCLTILIYVDLITFDLDIFNADLDGGEAFPQFTSCTSACESNWESILIKMMPPFTSLPFFLSPFTLFSISLLFSFPRIFSLFSLYLSVSVFFSLLQSSVYPL